MKIKTGYWLDEDTTTDEIHIEDIESLIE